MLVPCRHCGRSFREEALEKHAKICVKVFQKQRKAYDVTAHRMPQEALQNLQAQKKKGAKRGAAAAEEKAPDSKWRQKSEAFRQAMKQAKLCTQAEKQGKPLPPPVATAVELDDRTPCPHCARRFAQQAAERHIPWCKNQKAKAKGKAKSGPKR